MPSSKRNNNLSAGLKWAGAFLVVLALGLLLLEFWPQITMELQFYLGNNNGNTENTVLADFQSILGASTSVFSSDNASADPAYDFMLVIPKINAKALVVPNVDSTNKAAYTEALGKGIAHAYGSALPGDNGNTFLFAHSGRHFYESSNQNVQFYLLDKMAPGDLIYIWYKGNFYIYTVTETKRVWPEEISYLTNQNFDYNKLTLMSCWPAGINYQRQIVEAKLTQITSKL